MVGFRRCITALAVLALFAGLVSAQVTGNNQLTCSTNVSVTPSLRAEGYTEQTGDVTLTCSGGFNIAPGAPVPQVNITVFLNTAVTSRLLPISNGNANASEALILIDEPGSGLSGYGPSLAQKVCQTPATGCLQYVGTVAGATLGTAVDSCTTFVGNTCTVTSAVFGANVQQGIVNGNSVTWFGVPVLPPVSSGASRVYRITNIRANATSLSGGSAAGSTPVIASISISGATSLLLTNPTPTVGFVLAGLSAAATGATSLNQCTTQTRAAVNTLSFTEGFGTAFKTRVSAQNNNVLYAGQGPPISPQNVPGAVYNSESNFVLGGMAGNAGTAGLADFGTRLKATFNNVPAGIRLFVSTTNVVNAGSGAVPAPTPIGGSAGNTGSTGYAQLINGETTPDGATGFFPAVAGDGTLGPGTTGNVPVAEIPVVNGSAVAVWEVVNTNPNTIETIRFGVYSTFTANVAQNSPPAGTGTVNLSFAPTPPTFSASSAAAASSSLPIPRFGSDTSSARNLLSINICRTILLYPYVVNIQGFDTGLAIANTSTDPFGTGPQSGSCDLNWYQGATNPPKINTGAIGSGTVYTTLTSTAVPGFSGYMIAVCNFQYAHGFAFVSDLGARNLAMGYLALVIPDPLTQNNGVRNASANGCSSSNSDIKCAGGEEAGH
jgi:hypothetical protein